MNFGVAADQQVIGCPPRCRPSLADGGYVLEAPTSPPGPGWSTWRSWSTR